MLSQTAHCIKIKRPKWNSWSRFCTVYIDIHVYHYPVLKAYCLAFAARTTATEVSTWFFLSFYPWIVWPFNVAGWACSNCLRPLTHPTSKHVSICCCLMTLYAQGFFFCLSLHTFYCCFVSISLFWPQSTSNQQGSVWCLHWRVTPIWLLCSF